MTRGLLRLSLRRESADRPLALAREFFLTGRQVQDELELIYCVSTSPKKKPDTTTTLAWQPERRKCPSWAAPCAAGPQGLHRLQASTWPSRPFKKAFEQEVHFRLRAARGPRWAHAGRAVQPDEPAAAATAVTACPVIGLVKEPGHEKGGKYRNVSILNNTPGSFHINFLENRIAETGQEPRCGRA